MEPLSDTDFAFTYNGYTYSCDVDVDDDVRKIIHWARTPDNKIVMLPFSAYRSVSFAIFKMYVDLGLPSPADIGVYSLTDDNVIYRSWKIAKDLNAFGRDDLYMLIRIGLQ